ncbi:hypothetical protein [Aquimarina sp. 2201CG14-23]|uniref:hypothetical protein n=1 Tax=Aquimarina mycalae TaxID=3040073 RepID=UPI002477F2DB|nr:hypothetical protein [Aquimarina sp. 2201CG14-23]MDH7443995.1 hypothetical protein [Aquimarina sp. 2201CG14-23]
MIKKYIPQLLLVLLLSNFLNAQTHTDQELPSTIHADLTLTKNTTYIVTNDIQLSNGAILNIEEGVTLKSINKTTVTIIINGGSKVIASGSYDNPIKPATKLITKDQPIIVMKSSSAEDKHNLDANSFYYKTIENPTLLMSPEPVTNTVVSSVDPDF